MLVRLVFAAVVLGAVAVPVLDLALADSKRDTSRQRRLRSFLTKFTRKKLEISGRLRGENLQPLAGVLVYADISSCSLALPVTAAALRAVCHDERVLAVTDRHGRYRLPLRLNRAHRYAQVRYRITQADGRAAVIPLTSVDHMLGRLPAGSYYRLDRDQQLSLLRQPRDLIYATRHIALHAEQLHAPWLQENRQQIARVLAHRLQAVLNGNNQAVRVDEEIGATSIAFCGHHIRYRYHDLHKHNMPRPTRLVNFSFMFPVAGINSNSAAAFDCTFITDSRKASL